MSRISRWFACPPAWVGWVLFVLALALVFARNLPWHLDDKDQAKQAFVAVEILREGGWAWLFGHTPDGNVATKPPLMGWVNAGLRLLGLSWDVAWRLPGLLACGWLLWAIWQRGKVWGDKRGGWIAWAGLACFGFNLLTPRLGALVRTDMLLCALCGLATMGIYDALRARELGADPLEKEKGRGLGASWMVVIVLSLAAMLKGPVAWVFLLPGALLFLLIRWWLRRKEETIVDEAVAGELEENHFVQFPVRWWAWLLPLLPFVAWSLAAWHWQEGFYEQVVVREFLGRFQGGEKAVHNAQVPWFYGLQLSKALAPWVLLFGAISVVDSSVWVRALRKPSLLWLICAFLGGLLFMSAIPSKRLDRVFPVLVPLALLLPPLLSLVRRQRRASLLAFLATSLAAFAYSGYALVEVSKNWAQSDAFTRVLRDELREEFHERGISLAAGEVVSLENDYEALFVWLPEVAPVDKKVFQQRVRKQSAKAGEIRAVFVLQKEAKVISKNFPEAKCMLVIPSPLEAKNREPLELWLLE